MALPSTVTMTKDESGLKRYLVNSPTCTGEVYALGATVTSWAPVGADEVLWVSAESAFEVGKGIRGGIPICAPWFGVGRGVDQVPQKHGFVRFAPWTLTGAEEAADRTSLTFELSGEAIANLPGAHLYPADLHFRYTVTFGEALEAALEVSAGSDFVLDEALHTYFAVSDVRSISIEGLDGDFYLDKTANGHDQTQVGNISFTGETDRVYDSTATVAIVDLDRSIRIDKEGSGSTIVWNPWIEQAAAMPAFGDDEWPQMVCVEVGNALDRAKSVPAGTTARLTMRISLTSGAQKNTPVDVESPVGFTL